jgi:hypothetical protein
MYLIRPTVKLVQSIFKPVVDSLYGALIWPSPIIAKLRDGLKLPTGYQDESGFHFGAQPIAIQVLREPSEAKRRQARATDEGPVRDVSDRY